MKSLKLILTVCMVALLCVGCDEVKPFTYEQMLEDYDYLWTSIQENYSMMSVAQRKTGKNFVSLKDSYRNKITEETTARQFDSYVNMFLNEFEGIGQMEKLNDTTYKRLYEKLEESAGVSNSLNYLYDIVDNSQSKHYYNFDDTKLSDESAEKNLITRIVEEDQIAYLRMSDMDHYHQVEDGKKLKKFFRKIKDYPVCIIDLRGVESGVTSYWTENIVSLNIKEPLTYTTLSIMKGAMTKEYMSTEFELNAIRGLEALPGLQSKDIEGITDFAKVTRTIEPSTKKPIFHGAFYVLIDETVKGQGESFAMFCKQSGFATLIGTNSGGAGGTLEPLLLKLPNSGMIVRFNADNSLNPDGSCNEEIGTSPDIRYTGDDLLAFAIAQVKLRHSLTSNNPIE